MAGFLDFDIELDAPAALAIAAGMQAVAEADGDVHLREKALISAFRAELPDDVSPATRLEAPGVIDAYLRSLALVALADGRVSDVERDAMLRLAADHGIDAGAVDAGILATKKWFLQYFSGVRLFRDAVDEIAAELGLQGVDVA